MKKYNTVIFDLDGTLLNTIDDLSDGVNHVMEVYGFHQWTVDDIRRFVGNGIRNLMIKATPMGEENPRFEEIFQCFKEYYTDHCQIKTKAYDGIMELLDTLDKKGYKMAIVSNKNNAAVLELNEIYFAENIKVAIGEREGVRKKPSPDSVEEALRQLGSKKEDSLYVGDSEVDFATAKNAEMDCVLVTWGFRGREGLSEFNPKAFIDYPMQLVDILEP